MSDAAIVVCLAHIPYGKTEGMPRRAIFCLLLTFLQCGVSLTSGANPESDDPSQTEIDADIASHDWTFHIGEGRFGIVGWDSADIPVTMIFTGSDVYIYAVDCRMVAASTVFIPTAVLVLLVLIFKRKSKRSLLRGKPFHLRNLCNL